MTHPRQELAFGHVSRFGGFFGLLQGLLRPLLGGNVLLDAHKMGDLTMRIADRRDGRRSPVIAAVLFPVVKDALPDPSGADGLPEGPVLPFGHPSRFQDPGIFPYGLRRRIAGNLREPGIHIIDPAVGRGNDHRHGALHDGLGELPQLLLRLQAGGDVAPDA